MVQQPSYWTVLTRRKVLPSETSDGETKLNRVLGLYDLTALGVGSTLGAGVYVLAGQIARDQAGPSVMLSFAIAALASLLAGVCYAEFGARVPKAGSAYVYSYVCIGEFVAFVIGWNLILEYMIGTASVCRGISLYLDTLINDTLKNTFAEIAPMNVSFLGSYFDFFAFSLVIIFGVALAFGVETSAIANNFCTCLNIAILLFVIIAGSINANFDNWTIDVSTINATVIPPNVKLGDGGFFPFGFTGTLKGAATCFFGFVGFDCIATTGEEVRNPRRNIPRSILLSLFVIFLCYFGVSTVLTLMVPYYRQDPNAPLPYAFKEVGWDFAMWIVAIGGLIGLLASLFGALFPLPRVMYSMAEDGLLFRFLGKINQRYRVPVIGSIFAACITALISGLFDLYQLVDLLSIGTLLAYSVVAISVTLLRYMDNQTDLYDPQDGEAATQTNPTENTMLTSTGTRVTCGAIIAQLFSCCRSETPTTISTRLVGSLISLYCLLCFGIGLMLMQAYDALILNQLWALITLGLLVAFAGIVLLAICLQPREAYTRLFRVPFVPLVPAISIFINVYLMLQLDAMTWWRFGVWMIIGLPIFFACWCMYDIKNPVKRNPKRTEFARALKESSSEPSKPEAPPMNGQINAGFLESNENSFATIIIRNGHSAESLDQPKTLSDNCEEIEVKCTNFSGNICFCMEDSSSNDSTSEMVKVDIGAPEEVSDAEEEEEKSVMAMLDNVLLAEDIDAPEQVQQPLKSPEAWYDRKISIDSEMLPGVIETTVATVHSSDFCSEQLPIPPHMLELESESHQQDQYSYDRAVLLACELVDDVLNSPLLWKALEEQQDLIDAEVARTSDAQSHSQSNDLQCNSTAVILRRNSSSVASIASMSSTSVEDALHSDKFKQRLSQLILQTPQNHPGRNKQQVFDPLPVPQAVEERPLKQSKSETDIREMVLRVIDVNDSAEGDHHANGIGTTAIPKPPKFDPVLYKTIHSRHMSKERPSLERLLQKDKELCAPSNKPSQKVELPSPELPFRQKLEAILQRGPSHYSQKRPDSAMGRITPVFTNGDLPPSPEQTTNSAEQNSPDLINAVATENFTNNGYIFIRASDTTQTESS